VTRLLLAFLLIFTALARCAEPPAKAQPASRKETAPSNSAPSLAELTSPAGPGSSTPYLATLDDGSVLMSWLEPAGEKRHALRMSIYRDGRWSAPAIVASSDRFFVNWADFPSVVPGPRGTLFAHWLQKSGDHTYAYDVRVAHSSDGGRTWSPSRVLNDDGTKTEHGFVSLVTDPVRGTLGAIWLDGRNMKEGAHEGAGDMSLRFAQIRADGTKAVDVELDRRTCECCQTGMAMAAAGPVAVYRDRSASEVRDIAVVRWTGKGWSAPTLIHADGWETPGCPVNGPQIDADGNRVVVSWFTGAREQARVFAAFSSDGGVTFSRPLKIDDGNPVGRVDVEWIDASTALVAWIERTAAGAEIRARRVRSDGPQGPSMAVGRSAAARAAGFPRITVANGRTWFAWTEPGEPSRIRVSILDVKG
jgi:hypothetical protein